MTLRPLFPHNATASPGLTVSWPFTVTWTVAVAVAPLSSVTVIWTVKAPLRRKTCVALD